MEGDTIAPHLSGMQYEGFSANRLHTALTVFTAEVKARLDADRVSIFLFDRENCELWSVISEETKTMCLDARLGIAGHAALTGEAVNVADAYEHPLFYKEVDLKTGYRTRTLVAVPVFSRQGNVIAVVEAVNKKYDGVFTAEDAGALQSLAASIAEPLASISFKRPPGTAGAHEQPGEGFSTQKIVGMSHRIESVIRLIDQIRDCSVDVLIQGESGTGKELVARALHHNSPRSKGPFVALNCAALPDNLVEAELFGIEKGVATGVERRMGKFEAAHHGTLFLDEIGDLNLAAQAKLLRALQERAIDKVGSIKPIPIDVRVIAATNRNLLSAVAEKQFRADLYYRVKVIHIETPPLREISEDIPLLTNHFIEKHCTATNIGLKCFTPAALQCLMRYPWPGNNRQLENEIERLVATVRGNSIREEHLEPEIRDHQYTPRPPSAPETSAPAATLASTTTLPQAVEELERRMIETALRNSGGNKQKAAQALGLSRQGLIKKLKRLGL